MLLDTNALRKSCVSSVYFGGGARCWWWSVDQVEKNFTYPRKLQHAQ